MTILRSRLFRRGVAVSVGVFAALVLAASPALAHFCYRDFNPSANAGGSQAWSTKEEMLEIIPFFGLSPECEAILEEFVSNSPGGRMFMGPGLLAGGTLKNGKGNTPDNVGYLIFELPPQCLEE